MTPATFAVVLASVSLNALAQVVLRKAMTGPPLPPASETIALGMALVGNLWLWAGMACYAISIGLWLMVLSRVEVSAAYPMLSIGYVIAAVLGFVFLGENVSLARMAGIALICGGVVLVARTA
jgi:multidrug transporter EmrE-like cation transporter